MNKIAIVGHPSVATETLIDLLHQRGIAPAQPSKREQLLPTDITAMLCQAHQVPAQAHLHAKTALRPLHIGQVWHGLALDLLLGNLDQKAWCWADPRTVFVLDYWRDTDPDLAFILVYDDPARALWLEVPDDQPTASDRLDHWVAYNQVLLSFYHRHRQRCLLVHAQQAHKAAHHYLQHLQAALQVPLLETVPEAPQATAAIPSAASHVLAETLAQAGLTSEDRLHRLAATKMEAYLTPDLLAAHPASAQLYQDLQAVANLPWEAATTHRPSAEEAWQALQHQRQQMTEIAVILSDEKAALITKLQKEQEKNRQVQAALEASLAQTKAAEDTELKEENELLLLQLHQVQEELERYFLENQQLKQNQSSHGLAESAPIADEPALAPIKTYYGAADRIKSQLTYRLGAIMVAYSHKPTDWLRIPAALLRETQAFKRERAQRDGTKLPPIHTYADAYEAERVKRHLSYRLGVVLMERYRTPWGWLSMPWGFYQARKAFRAERKQAGR